jgi:hypothetical protein
MAAVVDINRLTGAGPTRTAITSINTRANADDQHTTGGTTNPVKIPTTGTNYSYWVSTQLEVISGLSGTIDNLKWFSTGSVGTGLGIVGNDASSYVQATGTVGETGIVLNTTNHTGLTATPVDVFTFTSGSPKSVPGTTTTSGPFGNNFVYQFTVGATAQPGATSQPTFTWQYDET